jgi:hypothetical protein
MTDMVHAAISPSSGGPGTLDTYSTPTSLPTAHPASRAAASIEPAPIPDGRPGAFRSPTTPHVVKGPHPVHDYSRLSVVHDRFPHPGQYRPDASLAEVASITRYNSPHCPNCRRGPTVVNQLISHPRCRDDGSGNWRGSLSTLGERQASRSSRRGRYGRSIRTRPSTTSRSNTRQSATGPLGSYPDRTHTGKRRRASERRSTSYTINPHSAGRTENAHSWAPVAALGRSCLTPGCSWRGRPLD